MNKTLDEVIEELGINITRRMKIYNFIENKVKQVNMKSCSKCKNERAGNEFKFSSKNRTCDKNNIINIIKGMSVDGFVNPITIKIDNDDFIVMDGQHRLIAAYLLGYDIYYTYCYETKVNTIDQIQRLNRNQRQWKAKDFIKNQSSRSWVEKFNNIKDQFPRTSKNTIVSILLGKKYTYNKFCKIDDEWDQEFLIDENYESNVKFLLSQKKNINELFDFDSLGINSGFINFLFNIDYNNNIQKVNEFVKFLNEKGKDWVNKQYSLKKPFSDSTWTTFFVYLMDLHLYEKFS